MTRRKILYTILAVMFAAPAFSQSLSFSGNSMKVLEETPEKSSGLEKIYVLFSTQGVTASYTAQSSNKINWLKYSNFGGGHAEETASSQNGNTSVLESLEGDMGYIIQDGDRQYCFWIVDYQSHYLRLQSAKGADEPECGVSLIDVTASGDPIKYFTINGIPKTLNQDITVEYTTQEWSDSTNPPNFQQTDVAVTFECLQDQYRVYPPNYCASSFRIAGDKFLKAWNLEESIETPVIQPTSVDARTFAEQIKAEGEENPESSAGSNQIGSGKEEGLGGSAPCNIIFQAYVTDGIIHNEWQLARDPNFENIDYRFTTQDLDYTFLEEGSHYLRYIGSNSDGSCEYISDTYEVTIGESQLLIPNAFSPNGDGINDEWKVAYKSILTFQCYIFDRQGHQVCHLTSPEQGWDGTVRGKTVDSGVFYYVIEATGTDGKKYKESGDINIVKFVGRTGTATTE